jgi:hypothetical protein
MTTPMNCWHLLALTNSRAFALLVSLQMAFGSYEVGVIQKTPVRWAVGVAFGRFDWRLATGERDAPPEPDPFDPLPAKSPGMLPGRRRTLPCASGHPG